jgi:phage terminase small subunit
VAKKRTRARTIAGKKLRFADEYLVDLNATRAYKAAGYRAKSDGVAATLGSRLLRDDEVAAYIAERQGALREKVQVTQEEVIAELRRCGFSSIDNYAFDDYGHVGVKDDLDRNDVMRAVSSIKRRVTADENGNTVVDTELKLWDKISALTKLGQHLGMFVERHEHKVEISYAKLVADATGVKHGGSI